MQSTEDYAEHLKFALAVAMEAGTLLKEGLDRPFQVENKGAINLVTEMDLAAEKLILERIARHFPDHAVLSEESADNAVASPYRWIVDPLDGTTNYAHRWPHFAVSIALEHAGEIVVGVVYSPVADELFYAVQGGGAALNGKAIEVSRTERLADALLNTGFPYDIREVRDNYAPFIHFLDHAQTVRRTGVAALDLCWVAMGRVDAYWEPRLFPWDVAAGALIVREAGGQVTRFDGSPFDIYGDQILASNGLLHPAVVSGLQASLP